MRDDTAPPSLPNMLFISLEKPSTLGGEHLQDFGSPGRRTLDGTDRVEVGEPRRGDAGGPTQDGAFGIFSRLRQLGRQALFGGHLFLLL